MSRKLPSLNALRAFEAAARLGRMSAAALELSVTPGAISRQVQQLERSLNVPLFSGSKNKPQLTPVGQTLLAALTPALDQIELAVKAVTNANHATLDVACFSTFMAKWLIPRLFEFHARHPGIEIRLQTTGHAAESGLERGDVVIVVQESTHHAPDTIPLFPEWLGPVLSPALAANLVLHSPQNLTGATRLQTRGRLNAWPMWAAAMKCETVQSDGPVFDHYYFTLEAALGGLGIAVAPWHLVAEEVLGGRLVAPFGFCRSGLHYVAKRRPQHNHRLDWFCNWLQVQGEQAVPPDIHRLE